MGPRLQPARWPPPVREGDRVGVAALSGAVDPDELGKGLEALRRIGLEPVVADNCGSRWGVMAGRDDERLAAFHRLVADPSLSAIFFARGGHGLLRALPDLDWELLARHPRAWIGYSDVTPFLLQVVHRLGLVAFHGPMVAKDMARGLSTEEGISLRRALMGGLDLAYPLRAWERRGSAEGVLIGGCLSLLATLVGTPWMPPLGGAILFLEDVDEPVYRIDRLLTHLRLAGCLEGVRGVVVGHAGEPWDHGICDDWHRETFLALPGPLAFGLQAGHGIPNLTLPLGAQARLDGEAQELRIDRLPSGARSARP
jgi:muramoyltetrapeptide carboxypeptidase